MRSYIALMMVFLTLACLAKQTAGGTDRFGGKITPTTRLKNYDKGIPYETRVDREAIKGKAIHWYSDGHAVTVTPHRVNCVYLTNTVDRAVLTVKAQKAAQKAAKHDKKNIGKAIDELTKLREKSSEALHPLYDEAIKMFEGAKEM